MQDVRIKEFESDEAYRASQTTSSIDTRLWPVYQDRCRSDVEKFMPWWPRECKVLDAGCGDGYTMDIIRSVRPPFWIYGIDMTPAKVEEARIHGHDVYINDLSEIKFKNQIFDVVYCRHVFEHVIKPKRVMMEFYRVLADWGRLCLIVPLVAAKDVRGKHPQEIPNLQYVKDLVEGAGFYVNRASLEKPKYGDEVWIWATKRGEERSAGERWTVSEEDHLPALNG